MFLKTYQSTIALFSKSTGWALLTAISITACQDNGLQNSGWDQRSPSPDCRVIEHAIGQTQICGKPEKIAVLEPKLLSLLLALNGQPTAYADAYAVKTRQFDNPGQQIPYLGDLITNQPINLGDRNTPSLESLILLKPDLILGLGSQENKLLFSIAPTIMVDTQKSWQNNLQIVAQAFNQEEDVHHVIATYKQKIAETRTALASLIKTHPRVLHVICSPSMDWIEIGYSGDSVRLLEEIGFQSVLLENVKWESDLRPIVTIETLAQLDADIIFVYTWMDHWDGSSTYGAPLEELKQKWAKNPLLQYSRAWKEDRIYFVDYTMWGSVIGGPIADFLILKQLPKLLTSPPQSNSK